MLIDRLKQKAGEPPAPPTVFDVGTNDFEERVLAASMEIPVLADFWAPWCGPCKQLMPVLEAEVRAAGGKVLLAKVNIDENPELAQALRVQSVPTVFAFFRGQPVSGFTGVRSQSEIKSLVRQLTELARQGRPDALNIPEALVGAAQALAAKDLKTAQHLYMSILAQDGGNVQAYTGLVRTFIAGRLLKQARQMVDDAPDEIANDPAFGAARTALELAEANPPGKLDKLQKKVEAEPGNHQARYDLSVALFAAGEKGEAIGQMLEIIRRDREWEEQKARQQLLKFFEALGPSDPDTVAGRRKLSGLLFS